MNKNAPMEGMINESKEMVELYYPRKCAWTNKLLSAKDKASI
jgi:small subunit ribosomal protein S21e